MVLSGKRPWARQRKWRAREEVQVGRRQMDGGATPHCGADTNGLVWLTANKDRQEKSRQPRRAKSDKPPGLPERVKVGDVGAAPISCGKGPKKSGKKRKERERRYLCMASW